MNDEESNKWALALGGEVGVEKSEYDDVKGRGRASAESEPRKPLRRVETVDLDARAGEAAAAPRQAVIYEAPRYGERVRMDGLAGGSDFGIKTFLQVLVSRLSFFSPPPDRLNPVFVIERMNRHFGRIETLVNAVRLALPRNNTDRSARFKESSPFAFSVLDTIRYWKIEKISTLLTKLQARPRTVLVEDFSEIIKLIYRPLFILELVEPQTVLHGCLFKLEELLAADPNPPQFKEANIEMIVTAFEDINRSTRYELYPVLLKLTSDIFLPYTDFFTEKRRAILAYLNLNDDDIIALRSDRPEELNADGGALNPESGGGPLSNVNGGINSIGDSNTYRAGATEADAASIAEGEAVAKGLEILNALFPEAGWGELAMFPDLYVYFKNALDLTKSGDLIDPENPMLQALILSQILEELFYGFRAVRFNFENEYARPALEIIDNWHKYNESAFERIYLPRLAEYMKLCNDQRPSMGKGREYLTKLRDELNWTKKLFFFPHFMIEAFSPPPFHKKDISPICEKIRILRHFFNGLAVEIDRALKAGKTNDELPSILNPWDTYVFQVQNPLSRRLNALLGKQSRTNVNLVFYTLSCITVLDHFLNNRNSWAYKTNEAKLFRSSDKEGLKPCSVPETKIDADAIFKDYITKRRMEVS
jgi:hypothetical protein